MDMVVILVAVAFLAVGMVIGGFIGASSSKSAKEAKGLRSDLDQAHDELNAYKEQVRQHFSRTSELVNDMTSSYRAVHEHLASSAQNLCDGSVENLDLRTPELLVSSNSKGKTGLKNSAPPSKMEVKENLAVKAQAASEAAAYDARTLFEKIGGGSRVEVATDAFVEKLSSDERTKEVYNSVSKSQHKAFLTFAFGGSDDYSEKDLKKLNRAHLDAVMEHLRSTLGELDMSPNLTTEVLNLVRAAHPVIDEKIAVDGVAKASLKNETPQVYH